MRDSFNIFRIVLVILFGSIVGNFVHAQKIKVASFTALETDLTGLVTNAVLDFSGNKCALIKIATTEKGFIFDVGTLGVVAKEEQNEQHPAEIYLYVPAGVKKITIQHNVLGIIRNYDLGQQLKAGRTYLLELTCDQVNTIVLDYNNTQILRTEVNPQDAKLFINGIEQKGDSLGVFELSMPFGTHKYRVSAERYHPVDGDVKIHDKDNKHILRINLKQAYGYLHLKGEGEMRDAKVLIDGIEQGRITEGLIEVMSGKHELTVQKPLFKPYKSVIEIQDSVQTSLTIPCEPNYGEVEISVPDNDAEIFIDGERQPRTSRGWSGKIDAGIRTIEIRKASHTTHTERIQVNVGGKGNYAMPLLKPIYGNVEMAVTPGHAEIFIDGVKKGLAAGKIPNVLVGEHKIAVRCKGYREEKFTVQVEEGKTAKLNVKMTEACIFKVTSSPTDLALYVDGESVGKTPSTLDLTAGIHRLSLDVPNGYDSFNKEFNITPDTRDMHIKLTRNYLKKVEFYIAGGYSALNCKGVNAGLGTYIYGLNLEARGLSGLESSEVVYWSKNNTLESAQATYKPQTLAVHLGYGIGIGGRCRITPQVGFEAISLKEEVIPVYDKTTGRPLTLPNNGVIVPNANAQCIKVALRNSFALTSWLGFELSADYRQLLQESAGYTEIKKCAPKLTTWSSGVNCTAGLYIYFGK